MAPKEEEKQRGGTHGLVWQDAEASLLPRELKVLHSVLKVNRSLVAEHGSVGAPLLARQASEHRQLAHRQVDLCRAARVVRLGHPVIKALVPFDAKSQGLVPASESKQISQLTRGTGERYQRGRVPTWGRP